MTKQTSTSSHLASTFKFNLSVATTTLLLASLTSAATKSPQAINTYLSNNHMSASEADYAVNMQDGGLILKETNQLQFQGGATLNVQLTYRSRSFHKGYFGQGWCSSFESELQFQGEGVVRLVDCQTSRPRLYSLSSTASSYINQEDPKDKILIKMGHYERQIKNEVLAKYNFKGQLIEVLILGKSWQLKYGLRKLPEAFYDKSGLVAKIKWHPILSLIEKLDPIGGTAFQYQYEGFNLKKIKTHHGTSTYNYDDLDNMVLRKTTNGPLKSESLLVEYAKELDQVQRILGTCEENYEFAAISASKKTATLKKKCHENEIEITKFEFEYGSKARLPAQVKVEENKLQLGGRISSKQSATEAL